MSSDYIFRFLRDKSLPRYVRPEMVMREMSRPEIMFNENAQYYTLVALGVTPQKASAAINEIGSSGDKFLSLTEASILSFNDPILSQMNISTSNTSKHVEIMPTGEAIIDSVLRHLLMSYVIYLKHTTGKLYTIKCKPKDLYIYNMKVHFTGKVKQNKLLQFMGIYN